MARSADRGILSIGAFLIIIAVSIVLGLANIVSWVWVPGLFLALCGCWIIVLSVMQASSPQKYGRGAFSFLGWGLLLVALGAAWFLYSYGWLYTVVVVLIVLGALAVAAAFRRK